MIRKKISKWHPTKKIFQFFLFVYWLFISSWGTPKPDFQAILCNYRNPEGLTFKQKPSFSRRNTTPGTGTLRKKRANAAIFETVVLTSDFPTAQKTLGPWQTKMMVLTPVNGLMLAVIGAKCCVLPVPGRAVTKGSEGQHIRAARRPERPSAACRAPSFPFVPCF